MCATPPGGRRDDVLLGNAADLRGNAWRDLAHAFAQRCETFRMCTDPRKIRQPFPEQHMQHRIEEPDVGTRQDCQMQIGAGSGIRAARIDHDDAHLRAGGFGRFDATVSDGVCVGRVGAGNQQAIGVIEILICTGWCIDAKGLLIGCHGAGHAQARIGVDVVGADQALGELVEDVIVLGQQLPGNIESDCIRPVFTDDLRKALRGCIQCLIPAYALAGSLPCGAQFWIEQPCFRAGRQMQGRALGA